MFIKVIYKKKINLNDDIFIDMWSVDITETCDTVRTGTCTKYTKKTKD